MCRGQIGQFRRAVIDLPLDDIAILHIELVNGEQNGILAIADEQIAVARPNSPRRPLVRHYLGGGGFVPF